MHDYVKNLAKVVRAAREEAHLSQAALAEQIGCDELSPKLRYIEPLPQKPVYHMAQSGINFNPGADCGAVVSGIFGWKNNGLHQEDF